jgi:SAM-dependent methyltransferase/uncharacterized protein YbaR (Trm112 family)
VRRLHFETLRPVCPLCRLSRKEDVPLALAHVERELGDTVFEGALHCSFDGCQLEYPIVDGIPILIPSIRTFVADNLHLLTARDDLSERTESILGDCSGPGSPFDAVRQHLSTYAWDHYGDLDAEESVGGPSLVSPGAVVRCMDEGIRLLRREPAGPVVDIGCAVGRSAFAMAARSDALVLGIDANLPMLRLAQRALVEGRVRYPRRRVGIVYDRREFEATFEGTERVDFWACDALSLPFADEAFGFALGLNVLDCVASPQGLLQEIRRVLVVPGATVVSTPYDWSPGATTLEAWIGGHSQRGPHHGASEPFLRQLLTPGAHPQSVDGLRLVGENESFPWHARTHDRSTVAYDAHVVAAETTG